MRKVIVTGATGFVGRALCAHLSRAGWRVRAAIRAATDVDLEACCEIFRIGDIDADTEWSQAVSGMDAVVHLAARVHVMRDKGANVLDQYRRVNTDGTLSLARASARARISRFIFLSTAKVNGEQTVGKPFCESDLPHPVDPYGMSKLEAECGLDEIARGTGLQVVSLRPPLIYGPRVKGNFLRLMALVRQRIPLPLASIRNSRSLLYVGNLVSAIEATLDLPSPVAGTYLLSDDHDLSTPDLVKLISDAMELKPLMFSFPPNLLRTAGHVVGKEDEARRVIESLRIDCTLIKHKLGWRPAIGVDAGIAAAVQAYRRSLS